MPECKGCGKTIVWGETEDGKRIPLDPKPPVYRFNEHGKLERVDASVTHFATCSAANDFSASKRKATA
jgi:hypothetical protein